MNSFLRLSGCIALALVLSASAGSTQSAAVSHGSELALPRADVLADGRVVLSFTAAGDLSGVFTLTLTPAASGGYSGEWAFTVAHTDNTDPETGVEPPSHGHDDTPPEHGDTPHEHGDHDHDAPTEHKDFVRLVHRGSLAGAVAGAVVTFDADGKLTQLVAPLTIDQGTLEFKQAQGGGQVTLDGLSLVF